VCVCVCVCAYYQDVSDRRYWADPGCQVQWAGSMWEE